MKFRSDPPDPSELPRAWLVWPIGVPVLILVLAWAAERSGHIWNIHGDGVAILLLFFASALFALVASIVNLSSVLPALRRYPSLRTPANLACASLAAIFVVVASCYFAFGLLQVFLR